MLFWHIAGCATQAPAPPPAKGGIYHVVKPGETLYRIGRAYDLNYAELARVNRLRDPNQIRVGQKLFIPGAARQLPVEMITPTDSNVTIPSVPKSSDLAGQCHDLAHHREASIPVSAGAAPVSMTASISPPRKERPSGRSARAR